MTIAAGFHPKTTAQKRRATRASLESQRSDKRLREAWSELESERCTQCGLPRGKNLSLCKLCQVDEEAGRTWP